MIAFLVRRVVAGALTLFAIATLCFVISRFAPGSPITSEKAHSPEVKRNLERHYGLDQPLYVQYFRTIAGYLKGDLGPSFFYRDRTVNDLVWPAFNVSIVLGVASFIIAILMGIPFGILSAARQNRWPDYLSMSVAVGGICIPNFLLGPLLVLLFCFVFSWLEPAGWPQAWTHIHTVWLLVRLALYAGVVVFGIAGVRMALRGRIGPAAGLGVAAAAAAVVSLFVPASQWTWSALAWANLKLLLLPAFTLAFVHVAYISRLTRAGMLDVMNKDYIRTARAKGLAEPVVVLKHGLKNGITPVVSYLGPMTALIVTGSIVVEKVFDIPGLGQHFVKSALNRDHGLTMGTVLVYSTLVIVLNFVVDLFYGFLDPRVRVQ